MYFTTIKKNLMYIYIKITVYDFCYIPLCLGDDQTGNYQCCVLLRLNDRGKVWDINLED